MNENGSFEVWLISVLPAQVPDGVVAYNFNLTECGDWIVELIGAATYDEINADWACPPVAWCSSPSEFSLSRFVAPTWESALEYVDERVSAFLQRCEHPRAGVMRQADVVCAGFVDGDLKVVWRNDE